MLDCALSDVGVPFTAAKHILSTEEVEAELRKEEKIKKTLVSK